MNKLKFTFNLIIILPTPPPPPKKTQKNQPIIEPPLN